LTESVSLLEFTSRTLSPHVQMELLGLGFGFVAILLPAYTVALHDPVTDTTLTNVFPLLSLRPLVPPGGSAQWLPTHVLLYGFSKPLVIDNPVPFRFVW